jgi:hypothetical protein
VCNVLILETAAEDHTVGQKHMRLLKNVEDWILSSR